MCDPFSIGLGATVIGGATTAYGQIKSGQAAKKAGERTQESYDNLAAARLDKVKYDISQVTRDYTRKTGENIASIGQSGIATTSFYDVLADSATEFAREKAAIRYTANQEAKQLREQGSIAYAAGKDAQSASYISAAGTVINTGTKLYGTFDTRPTTSGWDATTRNSAGVVI